ncbi:MAG TPA: MFS transporter [Candidatus Acidoferrales bacterium]|nr:MFS transporter [Candidatus Acidoferrales bacterium]
MCTDSSGCGATPRWCSVSPEFRKLWIGQGVSVVGSRVTQLALPLTAALTLSATPVQMGYLTAANSLPILFFALFAGAWADRLPHRPVLIVTDLARAAILVTIPIAAIAGVLTITHVLVAAFLAGAMSVLFRAAYTPFIPALVERSELVRANSRLALNESIARVAGPSLGGLLVQLVTAPIAIAADAASFVVSAVAVWAIRVKETPPARAERKPISREIGEGMRFVRHNPFIRTVVTIALIFNFAITLGEVNLILYATRVLGLDGGLVGAVFATGGVASVIGATQVSRVTARFGIGPSMTAGVFAVALSWGFVLAANGSPLVAALYLAVQAAIASLGAAIFNVTSAAVYQAAVPLSLQGRVGGTGQVLGLGLASIAALIGGWLGDHLGLWNTLGLSLAGNVLGLVYVISSPLRGIRTADDLTPTESTAAAMS